MVVGVKPLGHFHGLKVKALLLIAAGHGKIKVKGARLRQVCQWLVTGGNGPYRQAHIQYLIVEREVITGNQRNPRCLLCKPVCPADFPAGRLKLVYIDVAGPELFTGPFEFAVATDSWIAKVLCDHVFY